MYRQKWRRNLATYNQKIVFLFISILIISCDSSTQNVVGGPSDEVHNLQLDTVVPTRIYDGDTFRFYSEAWGQQEVRILDLDTYETSTGERLNRQASKNNISIDRALELGFEAKNWATQNILNREVVIERTSSRNTDIYDRLLRKVYIDGLSYDSIMKSNGWHTGL
jgi:endonuclease YncB( thermonuclease family)